MKLKEIKTVSQNVEKGGWVSDLPNLPGVSLKVRGTFNSDYNRLFSDLRADLTADELKDPKVAEAIEVRLLAETILVDWAGIEDDAAKPDKDGKLPPLAYSPELAEQLLSDPELKIFRRAVTYAGNVVAREGSASLEEATKNS
jgi:hypothetical protein